MKLTISLVLFFIVCGFSKPPVVRYSLSTDLSQIKWTGHAGAGSYSPTGTLKLKSGFVDLNGERIIGGTAIVNMQSLVHENKDLESHLKKADFFDCDKFPESVFTILSVSDNIVNGKLTIRKITREVSCPVQIVKQGKTIILKGKLTIDRTLFDIKYNSSSYFQDLGSYAISNQFELDLQLEGTAL